MVGCMIALGALIAAVPLAVADLVMLVVRGALAAVRWARPNRRPVPDPDPDPDRVAGTGAGTGTGTAEPVTRRAFIGRAATGTVLAAGAGSSFYGTFFGRHDYMLEEVPVRIPGLSPKLDGYTLAQL